MEKSRSEVVEVGETLRKEEDSLSDIQRASVRLARDVQRTEDEIDEKNRILAKIETDYTRKQGALEEQKLEASQLLYAMIRMQRMPKEFVIAMPGKRDELLRTASALHITYRGADTQMRKLGKQLQEISVLQGKMRDARKSLTAERKSLKSKQQELGSSIAERQRIIRKLHGKQDALKARMAMLSSESTSLKDLLGKLKQDEQLFSQIGVPKRKPNQKEEDKKNEEPSKAFTEMKGALPYPASGKVLHRYGQKNKQSNTSYKGQVMRTQSGAQVTALHKGVVVFTGDFLDYGNMVIVDHGKNYHSLLAGLERIDVDPGQKVIAGEPLGVMGDTAKAQELYLELRKDGKAIDPAQWMGNLKRNLASR